MTDEKIPGWCAGEDWCPMTAASDLLGKKWHPAILSVLMEGAAGFNDLKKEVTGISSKVLSESLEDLQDSGLVEREVISDQPFRVKYYLSAPGKDLRPVIEGLEDWADNHLVPEE